jgi:hypothetical protein
MTIPNWLRFLTRFTTFGQEPTVQNYLDLFDPQGTVQHPGMERPLAGKQIAAFISSATAAMPDFRLQPMGWCANRETLFVEARCSGTIAGQHVGWPALYCLTLRGERVLRGRSYYDRAAVLSHVDPELADRRGEAHAHALDGASPERQTADTQADDIRTESEFLAAYDANGCAPLPERFTEFYARSGRLLVPGMPHALVRREVCSYYRSLIGEIDDLRWHCQAWACRRGLLFVEWRMSGVVDGIAFQHGAADRFSLIGDRIAEAVSYFDTLALRAPGDSGVGQRTVFAALD